MAAIDEWKWLAEFHTSVLMGCFNGLRQIFVERVCSDRLIRCLFLCSMLRTFQSKFGKIPLLLNVMVLSASFLPLLAKSTPSLLPMIVIDLVCYFGQHWLVSRQQAIADKVNYWIDFFVQNAGALATCLVILTFRVSGWVELGNFVVLPIGIVFILFYSPLVSSLLRQLPSSVRQPFRWIVLGIAHPASFLLSGMVPAVCRTIGIFESKRLQERESELKQKSKYAYHALAGQRRIRVLVVSPWRLFQLPQCRLEDMDLDSRPQYIACSYVWGNQGLTRAISVDGYRLDVTETAFLVIRHQQSIWSERRIWIDAVCINQEDLAEKSAQVPYMNVIFTRAMWVDAYLAFNNDETTLWQLFGRLVGLHTEAGSPDDIIGDLMLTEGFVEQWDRLADLLASPWFSRVWIIQELVLAKGVYLHFGRMIIPWPMLQNALQSLNHPGIPETFALYQSIRKKRMITKPYHTALNLVLARRNLRTRTAEPLFDLVNRFRLFQASDPRDKIYALLSLTSHDSSRAIPVDYRTTTEALYTRSMRYFIQDQGLRCLLGCMEAEQNPKPLSLPSWVIYWPDAGHCYLKQEIPTWRAASHMPYSIQRTTYDINSEERILRVKAMLSIDSVGETIKVLNMGEDMTADDIDEVPAYRHRWISAARDIVLKLRRGDSVKEIDKLKHAFYTTLTHEVFDSNDEITFQWNKPSFVSDYEFLEQYLNIGGKYEDSPCEKWVECCRGKILQSTQIRAAYTRIGILDDLDPSIRRVNGEEGAMKANLTPEQSANRRRLGKLVLRLRNNIGRRIGVTGQGRVGSFPHNVKPGDEICLIAGAPAPFVVREVRPVSPGGVSARSIVGWCYLYDGMDGSLATGPWSPCDLI